MNIVDQELILLNQNFSSRDALLKAVGETLKKKGRITSSEIFLTDIIERENEVSTYMGDGIAIPHCKTQNISHSSAVLVRNQQEVAWNTDDEKTDLVFLLSIKDTKGQDDQTHLKVLSRLATHLMDDEFRDIIRNELDVDKIYKLLKSIEGGES